MKLSELFRRIGVEFEIDMPEDAEEKLLCVRDLRDFVRKAYRAQGIEISSGAVYDRICQIAALLTRIDTSTITPETRLADLMQRNRAA